MPKNHPYDHNSENVPKKPIFSQNCKLLTFSWKIVQLKTENKEWQSIVDQPL